MICTVRLQSLKIDGFQYDSSVPQLTIGKLNDVLVWFNAIISVFYLGIREARLTPYTRRHRYLSWPPWACGRSTCMNSTCGWRDPSWGVGSLFSWAGCTIVHNGVNWHETFGQFFLYLFQLKHSVHIYFTGIFFGGGGVCMVLSLLPFEGSTFFWHRKGETCKRASRVLGSQMSWSPDTV